MFNFQDWRYYKLGKEEYSKYMYKAFKHNLGSLRTANWVIVILAVCFSAFPLLFENNIYKMEVYLTVAFISLLLAIFTGLKIKQQKIGKQINNKLIYILTIIYYLNVILFGIYIGVWSNPDKLAVTFMSFLICALLPHINSPLFNLCLTLCAMLGFSLSTIYFKTPSNWIFDIVNVLIAGLISIIFCWQVSAIRISQIASASKLKEERDNYYNQSTVDELTQLKNRRDFTQTLQRYLTNYRGNDEWMWLAIADVDYFKKYNDHYGHPKGDEVLHAIGKIFNNLCDNSNIYAARLGGEEFALLRFEKDNEGADNIISNIHQKIAALNIPHEKSEVAPHVTISIGAYIARCGASNNPEKIYRIADEMLYKAKTESRNCSIICVEGIIQYKLKGMIFQ